MSGPRQAASRVTITYSPEHLASLHVGMCITGDGDGASGHCFHCTTAAALRSLQSQLNEARQDRLQKMWDIVSPYVGHQPGCTFGRDTPDGEFCSCGLAATKGRLREYKASVDAARLTQGER